MAVTTESAIQFYTLFFSNLTLPLHISFNITSSVCVPLHNQAPSSILLINDHQLQGCPASEGPIFPALCRATCTLHLRRVREVSVLYSSRMISPLRRSLQGLHSSDGFPSGYRGPGAVPQHSHSLQHARVPALLLWPSRLCPTRA